MLISLKIENLATIEKVMIEFKAGFTVVSGETGAGKSVFLSGLKLISGEKASSQLLRYGAEKGLAEAVFDISKYPHVKEDLKNLEIDLDDDEIIIQRELTNKAKSRARINGYVVPLSALNKIAKKLVQLHGQSEQVLLKDTRTHLDIIDKYADSKDLLANYKMHWIKLQDVIKTKTKTEARIQALAEQKEFIEFQFKELNQAELKKNEEDQLDDQLASLESIEEVSSIRQEMESLFEYSEYAVISNLRLALQQFQRIETKSNQYQGLAKRLNSSIIDVEDIYRSFKEVKQDQDVNPIMIDRLNAKMALIQRLKRKYHCDFNGLIELRDRRDKELNDLTHVDDNLTDLENEISQITKKINTIAEELHQLRKKSALKFVEEIKSNLKSLAMLQAEFCIDFQKSALTENGFDKIEFLLSPNPGEEPKSLSTAVSGGELSRVMLALKTALAHKDSIPLLLFDEVDSGISGQVGHKIGEALKKLGQYHQVLTITHLHQVASRAQNQLYVSKDVIDGKTHTSIIDLDYQSRVTEISRMMGGENETALTHAQELLEQNI